jgi:hypothetical protein
MNAADPWPSAATHMPQLCCVGFSNMLDYITMRNGNDAMFLAGREHLRRFRRKNIAVDRNAKIRR